MGLTKREIEEINEGLQRRVHELTAENQALRTQIGRLTSTLERSTGRVRELETRYVAPTAQLGKLAGRYGQLKSLLIEHLDESA